MTKQFRGVMVLLLASLAMVLGGTVAATAAPATAGPVMVAAEDVSPAATCTYRVRWAQAGVYDTADHGSVMFKKKYQGDGVTGPCYTVTSFDGRRWTRVFCTCDEDDVPWMRNDALSQLS